MNKMGKVLGPLVVTVFLFMGAAAGEGMAQGARAAAVIELNRALTQSMVVDNDSTLLQEIALEQFVVVAPGGVVENKRQATAGANSFDAVGVEITDEQVSFWGRTAVLVGKVVIDGEMRPVGRLPPMKFMAVFVEDDEGWRLLARSLTPCFEMAIAAGRC